jgi:hypothetical protein
MTMTDESTIPDWLPPPPIWPQWMLNALASGGLVPPASSDVPARIAFDWEEGPNGGLTGRPSPLRSQSNSRCWESIPSTPAAGGNDGILGSFRQSVGPPQFDPRPDKTIPAAWEPSSPKRLPDSSVVELMPQVETGDYREVMATRSDNMGHCLPLYVKCQDLHGGRLLRNGKRCGDCYNMCNLNGYWPFWYCPL